MTPGWILLVSIISTSHDEIVSTNTMRFEQQSVCEAAGKYNVQAVSKEKQGYPFAVGYMCVHAEK